jgi:hypothetical protein
MIVAELELGQVEREIFSRDVVVDANDRTFEERPKALDIVGMDFAAYILASFVINGLLWVRQAQHLKIGSAIRGNQFNLVRNHLADEMQRHALRSVLNHFASHVACPCEQSRR